jgi:hypothetical protein
MERLDILSMIQSVISMVSKWVLTSQYSCCISYVGKTRYFVCGAVGYIPGSSIGHPSSNLLYICYISDVGKTRDFVRGSVCYVHGLIWEHRILQHLGRNRQEDNLCYNLAIYLYNQRRSYWLRFFISLKMCFLTVSSNLARAPASNISSVYRNIDDRMLLVRTWRLLNHWPSQKDIDKSSVKSGTKKGVMCKSSGGPQLKQSFLPTETVFKTLKQIAEKKGLSDDGQEA